LSLGRGAARAVGRLLQSTASLVVSTLLGSLFGALVGRIPGDPARGLVIGAWAGGIFGLLCFAAAIHVPFGFRSFALWCLWGIGTPLGLFAATTATGFWLIQLGLPALAAVGIAWIVALPTFVALLEVLFPPQSQVARVVRGHGLQPFEDLRRQVSQRFGRPSAGDIWREALERHLSRWGRGR
jgi:hypothetical protein